MTTSITFVLYFFRESNTKASRIGTLTAQMNADGTPSSTNLFSVMYCDNRGRVIQT